MNNKQIKKENKKYGATFSKKRRHVEPKGRWAAWAINLSNHPNP